jgi:hypothetical protein
VQSPHAVSVARTKPMASTCYCHSRQTQQLLECITMRLPLLPPVCDRSQQSAHSIQTATLQHTAAALTCYSHSFRAEHLLGCVTHHIRCHHLQAAAAYAGLACASTSALRIKSISLATFLTCHCHSCRAEHFFGCVTHALAADLAHWPCCHDCMLSSHPMTSQVKQQLPMPA